MKQIMLKLHFFFVFSWSSLVAQQGMVTMESGTADYDGHQIILSQDVKMDHEIGRVSAEQMVLLPEEGTQKKMRFAKLNMQGDVRIVLKDGGEFSCASAYLDYLTLTGNFNSSPEQELVSYNENGCNGGISKMPVLFKSRQMTIKLTEEKASSRPSTPSHIQEIQADQNVTLEYNQDFIVAADHANYLRYEVPLNEGVSHKFPGAIFLTVDDPKLGCRVTNRGGDLIKAREITIDTTKRSLYFASPKGGIQASRDNGNQDRIDFSCDSMLWEENRDLLTLRDNVHVSQSGSGQIRSKKEVKIYHYQCAGKKRIRTIESLGETVLTHVDENKHLSHILTAYGSVIVDHEHLKTIVESPRNEFGHVEDGRQLYFQDYLGEIYADRAILDYEQLPETQTLSPKKLTLEGHVHILNRSSVNPNESESFLQYALADKVEFFPRESEMLLTSLDAGRVLFLDKVNNLQVSAPGIKIKRDMKMKKESIQGIGDVRFSFVDKELEKLKKHFSLDTLKGSE